MSPHPRRRVQVLTCGVVVGLLVITAAGCTRSPDPVTHLPQCREGTSTQAKVQMSSHVYGISDTVTVRLPACSVQPTPVLFLLHGAGADRTQWEDVGIFAADARVLLVIPDATSAYRCGGECGPDLATYLLDEITPQLVDAGYEPGPMAIGGISRGGSLAFSVVAERPDTFVALGAHSPAGVPAPTLTAVLDDAFPVWVDIGSHDSLLPGFTALADAFSTREDSSEIHYFPGGHDRDYWRSNMPAYLAWYESRLGVGA